MRFPLVVSWLPSRRLLALSATIHAAALSGVLISGLTDFWRLLGAIALSISAVYEWRRWRTGAGTLTLHSLAFGEYAPGGGQVSIPVVCKRRTLWSWLIVLELHSVDRTRRWRPAVCEDALPRDEFRRLSVCLRAGALGPARDG